MSNFTLDQQKAIEYENANILVSAGAGSGKTTVLTQRIINKLKNNVNINELLVLTFTNSAELEMQQRIKFEIQKYPQLKDQQNLLQVADILTFDSYLLKLVQKYAYVLGLDSNLKIGDDTELEQMLDFVIEEQVNILYKQVNIKLPNQSEYNDFKNKLIKSNRINDDANIQNDEFIAKFNLVDNYFIFKDQKFKEDLKQLYYDYINILNKDMLIEQNTQNKIMKSFEDFEKIINKNIEEILNELKYINGLITDENGQKFISKINESLSVLKNLKTYDQIEDYIFKFKAPQKLRKEFLNDELIYSNYDTIKSKIDYLKSILINKSKKEILEQEYNLIKEKNLLLSLLQKIDNSYLSVKKQNNIFNYQDITNLVLQILQNEHIKNQIKYSYKEILIDEYQDTNDFQNHFISLIANDNLYLVGDIKQSIYGFRNANPQNFNKLQKYFKSSSNKKGDVINLLDNFRSREEVLKSINDMFEILMHPQSEINYLDSHALNFGNKTYNKKADQDYFMEFINYQTDDFIEKLQLIDLPKDYYEPLIIANDIINKINNGYKVLDGDFLRKIEYKDIAILTKTKKSYEFYKEVFDFFSIPSNVQLEQYIYDKKNYELQAILSILKLILNPDDKLLQVSILRSFLYRLDEQKIYDYINSNIVDEKIGELKTNISNIKNKNIKNLNHLLYEIYYTFEIFDKVVHLPNIIGINEKFLKLNQVSIQMSKNGKNIIDLIKYLDFSINESKQNVEVQVTKENSNDVNIMTIHKSKGLEFELLYLPNMDVDLKKTNTKQFKIDKDIGLIMPSINNYIKQDSFLNNYYKIKEHKKSINENIRLLYVAMTRAKEKIIFVKKEDNKDNKDNKDLILKGSNIYNIKKYDELIDIMYNIKQNYVNKSIQFNNININEFSEYVTEDNKNEYKNKKLPKFEKANKYVYLQNDLQYNLIKKETFSKKQKQILNKKIKENIKLGIDLHNELEKINFIELKNSDYTKNLINNITNEQFKEIIINISKQQFIKEATKYWTEYEFVYEDDNIKLNGIIDLLIQTKDYMYIIDYKLSNLEDDNYKKQLLGYKKAMNQYLNKPIKCILYSLLDNEIKEIHDN